MNNNKYTTKILKGRYYYVVLCYMWEELILSHICDIEKIAIKVKDLWNSQNENEIGAREFWNKVREIEHEYYMEIEPEYFMEVE